MRTRRLFKKLASKAGIISLLLILTAGVAVYTYTGPLSNNRQVINQEADTQSKESGDDWEEMDSSFLDDLEDGEVQGEYDPNNSSSFDYDWDFNYTYPEPYEYTPSPPPTTYNPPPAPTCNESLKAVYKSSYDAKVSQEISRYQSEVNAINHDYSQRGLYHSGLRENEIRLATEGHENNLTLLKAEYEFQLISINCL